MTRNKHENWQCALAKVVDHPHDKGVERLFYSVLFHGPKSLTSLIEQVNRISSGRGTEGVAKTMQNSVDLATVDLGLDKAEPAAPLSEGCPVNKCFYFKQLMKPIYLFAYWAGWPQSVW